MSTPRSAASARTPRWRVRALAASRRLGLLLALAQSVAYPAGAVQPDAPARLPLSAAQRQALGISLVSPIPVAAGAHSWPATVVAPAAQTQWLATPVTGLLSAVHVDPNQRVRAGDPVATIRSAAVAEAAAAWLQAESQWQFAHRESARQRALVDEGVIPQARATQAQAAEAQARAQRDAQQARLKLLGVDLSALRAPRPDAGLPTAITLRAPVSGVVAEIQASAGQRLEEGTAVARIVRTDRLVLSIRLPAAQAAGLRPGTAVRDPQGRRIARLGPAPAAVSVAQTVELRAPLEGAASGAWLPGQSVEVQIDTGQAGWRVPVDAVFRIGETSWIYVERAGALVPVAVEPQARDAEGIVVRGPLDPTGRVASGDVAALKGAAMGIGPVPAGEAAAETSANGASREAGNPQRAPGGVGGDAGTIGRSGSRP